MVTLLLITWCLCEAGYSAAAVVKSKYQMKNQCRTENGGGGLRNWFKVWEIVQWAAGAHIPLGSSCGYLRMKF